jgi:hypothetical protein
MPNKKKQQPRNSESAKDNSKQKSTQKEKNIPLANNAGKLVNSGRSKNQEDLHVKNKVTGADFDGPPY